MHHFNPRKRPSHMGQFNRSLLLAVLAVLIATPGARGGDVQTDYDHNVNWERYRTFSFGHIQTKNPFYISRIRDGLTHYLTDRGWQAAPAQSSDATIFVVSNVRTVQDVQSFYNDWGGGWGWGGWPGWGGPGWTTAVPVDRRVRVVVVDIYDTHSHRLLWRGSSRDDLTTNSGKNTRALYVDFADMFHNFPPKP